MKNGRLIIGKVALVVSLLCNIYQFHLERISNKVLNTAIQLAYENIEIANEQAHSTPTELKYITNYVAEASGAMHIVATYPTYGDAGQVEVALRKLSLVVLKPNGPQGEETIKNGEKFLSDCSRIIEQKGFNYRITLKDMKEAIPNLLQ